MSILISHKTRLIVQGITGIEGSFHARQMFEYKTNIVAGVSPGKGGGWVLDGKIPVFDTVSNAVDVTGADASVIFVPARHAADAIFEAADAGIPLIICITEGIPVQDTMRLKHYLDQKHIFLIGPNCPGILTPGEAKAGIIPVEATFPGNVGLVSRSGTLTYEVMHAMKQNGIGVSTCVGIGGDPIKGASFSDILELFENDPHTEQVVLIGEIGGMDEEMAADTINNKMTKRIVAYIVGVYAPTNKKMGHAGAIVEKRAGSATDKIKALQNAGVRVATHPEEIPLLLKQ